MGSSATINAPERSALIQPFYPGLDGLRAIAFLSVFVVHYGPLGWDNLATRWGWVGVDLFFVVSGFLITGILHDSFSHPRYFHNFYVRRSLRIFPVSFSFWLAVLLLTPLFQIQWDRHIVSLALYVGNLFLVGPQQSQQLRIGMLTVRLPWNHHEFLIPISHLWSLCVEEQFYLVWPAVMWFVRSRRQLLRLCLAIIVIAPVGRTIYFHLHPEISGTSFLYYNTFSRIDTILVGAAIALWLRGANPSLDKLRLWVPVIGCGAPLILAAAWITEKTHTQQAVQDPVVCTIGYTLIALAAAALLLGAIGLGRPFARGLQWKPLRSLGRISYGLYLFHLLPYSLLTSRAPALRAHHLSALILMVPLGFDITLAWLSFRYLESPFLRLKSILAPDRTHVADPEPIRSDPPTTSLSPIAGS